MAHDHAHEPIAVRDLGPAFKWAVSLNVSYVLIEAVAGLTIGSLALLADAAHNLTDVAGLLIAWAAAVAALVGVGAVVWESVQRFSEPVALQALPVLIVAAVGIAINAGTALLFKKDREHDLNAEGAFLHMVADAAVSAGVVLSAGAMLATGWLWLDPLAAILVSLVIAWTAFGLLRSSFGLALDAVPGSVDRQAVDEWLRSRPGVAVVHDLHVWSLSTTSIALTAHLVMPDGHPGDAFLDQVADDLEDRFGVAHSTLQIETGDGTECRFASAEVV